MFFACYYANCQKKYYKTKGDLNEHIKNKHIANKMIKIDS